MKKQHNWTKSDYSLSKQNFVNLLENKIPCIRLPGLLSKSILDEMLNQINQRGFDFYEGVDPPIGRIGTTVFENQSSVKDYFNKANKYYEELTIKIPHHQTVLKAIASNLSEVLNCKVDVAHSPDSDDKFYAGLIRVMKGGALLHIDYAPMDARNFYLNQVVAQVSWNLFLELPHEGGGEVTVFNKPWSGEDESYKIPDSYGYNESIIHGVEKMEITPEVGEIIFFNSQNFHKVNSNKNINNNRITISSFIGKLPTSELILWS